ncbi:MAG TPA: thiaminase II [Candidatus Methylomirabilis sp.]|nr:thiaminase II [Candidatus Methylomirabilis sp.]
MTSLFSHQLRRLAEPIWAAQHAHPFVQGIGDGTLPLDKFRFWVRQDYLYLIDYARVFAAGALRAPDLDSMTTFADLLHATLKMEMDLHRSYADEFGISPAELERERKAPTTQGYTDFLLRVATLGDFAEFAAALLPCMWGFCEVGETLAARGMPAEPRYAKWIAMYSAPEFAELARWCRELVDRLGRDAPAAVRARMEEAFLTSSRYELAFWEMAWTQESWPGESQGANDQ